ncbi:octanoyltransferase [Ventosimonas gracilis]|uniref:Octanoyltransferase n=1 Tax=Ventosimonas gracilis TaxID=1680762 RepID=A0A139SIA5_9GAMM|nr:lipoyl(octanoyl) transferase LipB [Ventosimonas gracilis]KXU34263.1 octanoyltransferase [Ventosimonas gracilis]
MDELIVRELGLHDYFPVWQAMQRFTDTRTGQNSDELWLLQHAPVFTLGQAGKLEHLLAPGDIPLIKVDRGGQVTYHGPGQLIAYLLLDIRRKAKGVRDLVRQMECSLMALLASYGISAQTKAGAPGVYVDDAKIASLGLRIRRGCSFHGLALNVAMDLEPFSRINPCGYQGLRITQMQDFIPLIDMAEVSSKLCSQLAATLGYPQIILGEALSL